MRWVSEAELNSSQWMGQGIPPGSLSESQQEKSVVLAWAGHWVAGARKLG